MIRLLCSLPLLGGPADVCGGGSGSSCCPQSAAALEVPPLGCSECHTLERARGLLLRRLFGRQGFGAVAGDDRHESVTG